MSKTNKLILALIAIVAILAVALWNKYSDAKNGQIQNKSITAKLEKLRNEKGQEEAKIAVILAEKKAALLKAQTKDTLIMWLQEAVKEYKGALNTAIVLSNNTGSQGVTNTVVYRDTTIIREVGGVVTIKETPAYETSWSNQWETGHILATSDSIYRDIKIKNEYEITLGATKNGWFKPKEYEVKIVNLNPNTETEELRSFQVKTKPKRLSLGVQAGYGLGLLDMKPQPFIGIGAQFNIVSIK